MTRPVMSEGQRQQLYDNLASMDLSVVIVLSADGRVTAFPPFRPGGPFPDLPSLLRFMADVVIPDRVV